MDSFVMTYVVELVRVELAKHLPALSRLMHDQEDQVVAVYQRAGTLRKSVMVAALVWSACYTAVVPWMAMQLDPPILTASVATLGSVAALVVYTWWCAMSAVRSVRRKLGKA